MFLERNRLLKLNVDQRAMRAKSFKNTFCKCLEMLNVYVSENVFFLVRKTRYFRVLIRAPKAISHLLTYLTTFSGFLLLCNIKG